MLFEVSKEKKKKRKIECKTNKTVLSFVTRTRSEVVYDVF